MIEVRRKRNGKLLVIVPASEAGALLELPRRLRELLEDPDFSRRAVVRLFPRAHDDPGRDAEYRELLGDDLRMRKLEGVAAFEGTIERCRVRNDKLEIEVVEEVFDLWLGTINDMRLVLGADLEIEDEDWCLGFDPTGPRARDYALLHWLSWLEEELLEAVRTT